MTVGIKIDWNQEVVTVRGGTPYKLIKETSGPYPFVVAPSSSKDPNACRVVDAFGVDPLDKHLLKNKGVDVRAVKSKIVQITREEFEELKREVEDLKAFVAFKSASETTQSKVTEMFQQ